MCHGVGADAAGYEHGEPPTRSLQNFLATCGIPTIVTDKKVVGRSAFEDREVTDEDVMGGWI